MSSENTITLWEYRVEFGIRLDEMNELGLEGWEMVGFHYNDEYSKFVYIFKRPKQS